MGISMADTLLLQTPTRPITVTFRTAKQISGLGLTTLWGLAKVGRLKTVHVGRRTLIVFDSLEQLLKPAASPPETACDPSIPTSGALADKNHASGGCDAVTVAAAARQAGEAARFDHDTPSTRS